MDLLLTKREGVLWKDGVAQSFRLVVGCSYGSLWAKNPNSPGTPPQKNETEVWDSSPGLHLKEGSQSRYRVIHSSPLW